jgi:hypothetical protein
MFKDILSLATFISLSTAEISAIYYLFISYLFFTYSIATRKGLDGLGTELIFRTHPDRPWGTLSLLYREWYRVILEVKRPGRGVDHPPHLVPKLM